MPSLSSLTVRIGRAPTPSWSRPFSAGTTRALQRGSFFNLGGLGASREAQYLSKERGVPLTEYSANVHRIRLSEVDPFAPAPGATPSVAAARAAQALDQSRIHNISVADSTARHGLAIQLQVAAEDLERTKRALGNLQARSKGLETAIILIPILGIMMGVICYHIYRERGEKLANPWQNLSSPLGVQAQQSVSSTQESRPPHRDAYTEDHPPTNSCSKAFEGHPTTSANTGRSFLQGLFWASDR